MRKKKAPLTSPCFLWELWAIPSWSTSIDRYIEIDKYMGEQIDEYN